MQQADAVLIALYEIRNNRGVGHVGGEVDANHMDAVAVRYMAKWLVTELVRVFHNLDTTAATEVVDALVEREIPVIWQVGDRRRVLQPKLSMKDRMLLLLCPGLLGFPPRQGLANHREWSLASKEVTTTTKRRQSDRQAATHVKRSSPVTFRTADADRVLKREASSRRGLWRLRRRICRGRRAWHAGKGSDGGTREAQGGLSDEQRTQRREPEQPRWLLGWRIGP